MPNLPNGEYTLTVSFLGYPEVSRSLTVSNENQILNIQIESLFDEIVVLGTRSAQMQALNQERTSPVTSTVVSADQLGVFNGTTISEALRRAPGISFIPDASTGDGANVIVRGLEPDLNQVQLNGIRLLDGTGLGRSPDLSSFLTESIESVTISKSLLPSHDSNGAGALIEVETKSPLDRARRFVSFNAEYGERGNDFGDEFLLGGTVSGTFGENDDFGSSLSVSYRERDVTNLNYDLGLINFGQYLPLADDGTPAGVRTVDPRTPFPFESGANEVYPERVGANQGSVENTILSIAGALEKQFGSHTSIRLDATYTEREDARFALFTNLSALSMYDTAPVPELGGELRNSLVSEDPRRNSFPLPTGTPQAVEGNVFRSASYSPRDTSENLVLSLRGDTVTGGWKFGYQGGYSVSESNSGERFNFGLTSQSLVAPGVFGPTNFIADRSFLSDEAIANQTGDGRIVSIFAPLQTSGGAQFVLPLFNQAGFDFYNDPSNVAVVEFSRVDPRRSEAEALTLDFSARRDFDFRNLKYLEVGVTYQDTEFFSPGRIGGSAVGFQSFQSPSIDPNDPAFVSALDLGLTFGPGLLTSVGAESDLIALERASVEAVSSSFQSLVESGLLIPVNTQPPNETSETSTAEETFSAYVEGRFDIGKLEIVGGVRIERLDLSSTFFTVPVVQDSFFGSPDLSQYRQRVSDTATQTDVLPRLALTYRQSENMVFRGAYYTTVSQPQLNLLTDRDSPFLSFRPFFSTRGAPATFTLQRGNPELKPATTHNFSADAEYYTDDAGVFSVSVFYKEIEDSLQNNDFIGDEGVLPDDFVFPEAFFDEAVPEIPDGTEFRFIIPGNSGFEDTIWGVELNAVQQFGFMPSPWDGFGIIANYTYTDSDRTEQRNVPESVDPSGEVFISGVPFAESPEHQGTVGLTYAKFGIDSSLLYTAQDRRLSTFNINSTSEYNEVFDSLDFQFIYTRTAREQGAITSFFFRANDLLRDEDDSFLELTRGGENGSPAYFTGATFLGGRSFEAGFSVIF